MTISELIQKQREQRDKGIFICILGWGDYEPKPIPKVNEIYYSYDDGKIRPTREYRVKVLGCIRYENAPPKLKELWEQKVIERYWVYEPIFDYFVKVKCIEENRGFGEYWYCRSKNGGWFGFANGDYEEDDWDGELDIDGKLYKIAHKEND